jgi:phosphopentomutase
MARRAAIIVLDGLGIGPAHDTAAYGDAGSDTLGNTLRAAGRRCFPELERLGLGCCAPLPAIAAVEAPRAAFGTAQPRSAGKDSTTGHWELCGLILERPFPTYPRGFPPDLIAEFARRTGRGVLGNRAASGTAIIAEYGEEHQRTGRWIVYTSADSVFQVAAHEETVPLEELWAACREARDLLQGEHAVSRVIARPFVGRPGSYRRTAGRRDFSLPPPGRTLLDECESRGIPRVGVGKVDDLFAGRGIASTHTATNGEAYRLIREALTSMEAGLLLANVIEFDQTWGHRNDVPGFLQGLEELDRALPDLLAPVRAQDLIIFTADHGNDPTTPSTDHSRERVPVLVHGPNVGAAPLAAGTSFLSEVWRG